MVVILSHIYRIAQSRSDIDLPLWHSPIDLPTSTIYTVASLSAIFQTAFPVQGRRKTEMKRIIDHGPVYIMQEESCQELACRQTRPRREVTCFLEWSWNLVAYHVEVGSSALHSASLAVARVFISYCLAAMTMPTTSKPQGRLHSCAGRFSSSLLHQIFFPSQFVALSKEDTQYIVI